MTVIIAFDYGVKKMGVAVGNTETQTSQPLNILPMDNGQPDWSDLLALISEWQATTILVGLPLNMDGSDSHLSKRASKFAKRLNHKLKENHTPCALYMVDERLTSHEAKGRGSNTKPHDNIHENIHDNIDDAAAHVLLESWLHEPQGAQLP